MEWDSLQGYIGARAAVEARLGKYWPEEYERQDRNPSDWVPLEGFGGEMDLSEAEAAADRFYADRRVREKKSLFFNRLREAKRCKAFLNRALFREARTMDDVYELASLVVQFDLETPAWMKSIKACAEVGLEPLADLWDFVSAWFDRAEVLIRKLMTQPRYVLNCWVDDNRDTVVRYDGAEGYLRAFRPMDQLKIAKEADYARLH